METRSPARLAPGWRRTCVRLAPASSALSGRLAMLTVRTLAGRRAWTSWSWGPWRSTGTAHTCGSAAGCNGACSRCCSSRVATPSARSGWSMCSGALTHRRPPTRGCTPTCRACVGYSATTCGSDPMPTATGWTSRGTSSTPGVSSSSCPSRASACPTNRQRRLRTSPRRSPCGVAPPTPSSPMRTSPGQKRCGSRRSVWQPPRTPSPPGSPPATPGSSRTSKRSRPPTRYVSDHTPNS